MRKVLTICVLAAVLAISSAAQATLTHYTDRTAFEAALVQTATFGVGDYSGWDSASSKSLSDSATGFGLTASTNSMFYDAGDYISTEGSPAFILMELTEGINAIGGYFGVDYESDLTGVTVTLTTTSGGPYQVLDEYYQDLDMTPAFNGWIVTGSELTSLKIEGGTQCFPAFGEDMTLGSTVPEPATLCLLGLGGLLLRRRKKA